MTEEIIIDGVRVDECSYYNKDNKPYCCEIWDNECEAQNCYYKQFLHLKQENQALRRTIKDKNIVGVCEELEKLKQENETLKKDRDFWCKKSGDFENFLDTITNNEDKYRSALEEIREIINGQVWTIQDELGIEKMYQIINEVLNESK